MGGMGKILEHLCAAFVTFVGFCIIASSLLMVCHALLIACMKGGGHFCLKSISRPINTSGMQQTGNNSNITGN